MLGATGMRAIELRTREDASKPEYLAAIAAAKVDLLHRRRPVEDHRGDPRHAGRGGDPQGLRRGRGPRGELRRARLHEPRDAHRRGRLHGAARRQCRGQGGTRLCHRGDPRPALRRPPAPEPADLGGARASGAAGDRRGREDLDLDPPRPHLRGHGRRLGDDLRRAPVGGAHDGVEPRSEAEAGHRRDGDCASWSPATVSTSSRGRSCRDAEGGGGSGCWSAAWFALG